MVMASESEVVALQSEIQQLQAGLDAAVQKMRALGGELPNGHTSTIETAEKMWTEVKRQAQTVGHEIEERPLVSAATALAAGIASGLLFGGRRT